MLSCEGVRSEKLAAHTDSICLTAQQAGGFWLFVPCMGNPPTKAHCKQDIDATLACHSHWTQVLGLAVAHTPGEVGVAPALQTDFG